MIEILHSVQNDRSQMCLLCHPERKEPLALSEVEGEGSGLQMKNNPLPATIINMYADISFEDMQSWVAWLYDE